MTRPIFEPSTSRTEAKLGFSADQLFRRPGAGRVSAIEFLIDGGGAEITTGLKGFLEVPFNCEVTAARIVSDQDGDIVVDIWMDTYANFPPVNADSITGGNEPELSGTDHAEDTTLSGWTTTLPAGDWLGYNVDSVADVEIVTVSLTVTRT